MTDTKRIVLSSDHAGIELRQTIGRQAATIHAQRHALQDQANEIERLRRLLGSDHTCLQ